MHTYVGTTLGNFVHLDLDSIREKKENQDVYFDDIATCLSKKNRFNDHGTHFWSVSDHSVLAGAIYLIDRFTPIKQDGSRDVDKYEIDVSTDLKLLTKELLYVFSHDFTEAYIGDCPSPFKRTIPEFSLAEDELANLCILPRLGLDHKDVSVEAKVKLKHIDHLCGVIEMHLLFPQWKNVVDNLIEGLNPWQLSLFNAVKTLFDEMASMYYGQELEQGWQTSILLDLSLSVLWQIDLVRSLVLRDDQFVQLRTEYLDLLNADKMVEHICRSRVPLFQNNKHASFLKDVELEMKYGVFKNRYENYSAFKQTGFLISFLYSYYN